MVLPGYTHLQRAQPVLAAHYFLAYVEKFQRDRERLADCRKRGERPAARGGGPGRHVAADRPRVGRARSSASTPSARNSLDVSSDRDFLLEFVFGLSLIAVHLSGWAEEWVIWATTEFDFLDLPDAFCTGSSIMPHKKNPDVLELTRGKSARVIGGLHQLLVLVKGLPLAYNRDLQEDKAVALRRLRHGGRVPGGGRPAGAADEAAAGVDRGPARRRLPGRDDADGVLIAARRADADGPRGGRAAGAAVRAAAVPAGRLAGRGVRGGRARGRGERRSACWGWRTRWRRSAATAATAPAEVERQLAEWTRRLA